MDNFKDGVWLVEIGPVADPALVPQAVASVLSVREEPGRAPLSALVEFVRSRHLLVLLDSCEHVVQACAELANTLLRAAPELHILVTSREVLGINGETTWRVPSLSLPPKPPPPPESLDQYEAVGLFVERATAANTNFRLTPQNAAAVMEICARLDGIPLAIELAAARVRMLSVEQIAARLDDRFRLLTGGSRAAMPRQRTLRALVDWSYGLLQETERMLFRRLSIFAGGWTLEAAETICAVPSARVDGGDGLEPYDVLDLLMQLVDKSLVIADEQAGQERYRTLETIREYARERLAEAGETRAVQERHHDWFMGLAEQAAPEGYDTQGLASVGHEYDNLRAALRWAIDSGESERALRLAGGLWSFWSVRGFYTEGGRGCARSWRSTAAGQQAPGRARGRCRRLATWPIVRGITPPPRTCSRKAAPSPRSWAIRRRSARHCTCWATWLSARASSSRLANCSPKPASSIVALATARPRSSTCCSSPRLRSRPAIRRSRTPWARKSSRPAASALSNGVSRGPCTSSDALPRLRVIFEGRQPASTEPWDTAGAG